jgi:hypothetical protein
MIKENKVEIRVSTKNIKRFLDLKYECRINDRIFVDINHLSKNCHIKITAICDICGEEKIIPYQKYRLNKAKLNLYTCHKCSHIKNKKTCLERYGDENYVNKEKTKLTNIEKYGCVNVFQNEKIKDKIKKTNIEKYGVEFPQQNKEILSKSIKTTLIKYEKERPSQNKKVYDKIKNTKKEKYNDEYYNNQKKSKETLLKKYGINNVSMLPGHKESVRNYYNVKIQNKYNFIKCVDYEKWVYFGECEKKHSYSIDIDLYHNRLSHDITTCTVCYPEHSLTSDGERKLLQYIKDNYNGNVIENDRKILEGKELDIYLPELNLAFEYNGTYWHSEIFKDENYHVDKTKKCENKNIKLVHVWEKEWKENNDNIKKQIKDLLHA